MNLGRPARTLVTKLSYPVGNVTKFGRYKNVIKSTKNKM
jgi:hypothetical protein